MYDLMEIAARCRGFRETIGKTQADVAVDTGYCVENISKFERGLNNNLLIFLWYVGRGFKV